MTRLASTALASQQEAVVQCQQILLPIVNGRMIEGADLFIFLYFIYFCLYPAERL